MEVLAIGWGFHAILLGISIQLWNDSLAALKLVAKQPHQNKQAAQWKLVLLYRKCQIFTTVLNAFSQTYLLPTIQITNSALLIACLFTAIMARGKIPMVFYVLITAFMFIVAGFGFLVLDVASRGFLHSKRFISCLKTWPLHKNGLFRKYIKSFPALRIQTGPFHAC